MVGGHLKNKSKSAPKSMEEFIAGAEDNKKKKEVPFTPSPDQILLSFTGRLDRGKDCDSKGFLVYLKHDNARDIQKHCHGSKQGIIKYLVRRGLDSLIEEGKLQLVIE